jgi:signal transduction histidine kinase
MSTFPWFAGRVLARAHLCVPDVRALPPEAAADRAACEALGIGSVYAVPMVVADAVIGWLGFVASVPRRWPAEVLRMLDVAAEMLAGAVERKRAARTLAKHREFERLIAHLATDFINIPSNGLDAGMRGALRELALVTGDDWAVVFVTDEGSTTAIPAYEWRNERFAARRVTHPPVALGPDDPLGRAFREAGVLHLPSLDALPAYASRAEREKLEGLGIGALVDVPLIASGELLGFLGFASHAEKRWPPETIALLRVAGEMFANAIERMRTENRMRRHEAELAHALRMGTMGELAAGLAHELNQPLAAILGFARGCENRLRNGKIERAELVSTLRKIAEQALRAGDVIRTMRAHVRKGEPRRQWCNINDLVADVLRLGAEDVVRNGVRLVEQLETKLPKVQVDPTQIQQVLLNLLRNAVDAVAARDQGRTIVVSTSRAADGGVEVAVADTGAGLKGEMLERVFEPFYTTKNGGLGLGLSIARSIVEAHAGRLWATSDEGMGATFRLTLYRSKPGRGRER